MILCFVLTKDDIWKKNVYIYLRQKHERQAFISKITQVYVDITCFLFLENEL